MAKIDLMQQKLSKEEIAIELTRIYIENNDSWDKVWRSYNNFLEGLENE